MKEAYAAADEVIDALKKHGLDYLPYREYLAKKLFDDGLFEGNWDVRTRFDDGIRDLRVINESEYEQHMGDEKPKWDNQLGYSSTATAYIFFA